METEIFGHILEYVGEKFKDDIDVNKSFEEYLSKVPKNEIIDVIKIYILIREGIQGLGQVTSIESKSGKEIVNYLITNIEDIFSKIFMYFDDSELEQLKFLVKHKGFVEIDFNEPDGNFILPMSIKMMILIKRFCIGFINYQKSKMVIYIPMLSLNAIEKVLEDKKVIIEKTKINKILNYVNGIVSAYGIVEINHIFDLYAKQVDNTKETELFKHIQCRVLMDDYYNLLFQEDKILIAVMGGEENNETLMAWYNSSNSYYEYSYNEFMLLGSNSYYKQLTGYKTLRDCLINEWEFNEEDLIHFDISIIEEYLYVSQFDKEEALKKLNTMLDEIFEFEDESERFIIVNMIMIIENNCPKWKLKGHKNNQVNISKKVGRNELCLCGSGKKYKKCCGQKKED